ncbi:MAG: DMT family transporter [Armatimonadota bacterium]
MIRMTPLVLLFIFLTIAFTVVGQLLVKQGMLQVGSSPPQWDRLPQFILRAFMNGRVVLGLLCAVGAAVCWTLTLSRAPLSFAYPFMGLAIVLVLAISPIILGEVVTWTRWVGVLIVAFGIWLAAQR